MAGGAEDGVALGEVEDVGGYGDDGGAGDEPGEDEVGGVFSGLDQAAGDDDEDGDLSEDHEADEEDRRHDVVESSADEIEPGQSDEGDGEGEDLEGVDAAGGLDSGFGVDGEAEGEDPEDREVALDFEAEVVEGDGSGGEEEEEGAKEEAQEEVAVLSFFDLPFDIGGSEKGLFCHFVVLGVLVGFSGLVLGLEFGEVGFSGADAVFDHAEEGG